MKEQRTANAAARHEERHEDREVISCWMARAKSAEASKAAAVTQAARETVHELREYQQRAVEERDAVRREAAELTQQTAELEAALERVRTSSKSGLLDKVAALQQEVKELSARRKFNQMTIKEASLHRRNAAAAVTAARADRARINEFWGSDRDLRVRWRSSKLSSPPHRSSALSSSSRSKSSRRSSCASRPSPSQARSASRRATTTPLRSTWRSYRSSPSALRARKCPSSSLSSHACTASSCQVGRSPPQGPGSMGSPPP